MMISSPTASDATRTKRSAAERAMTAQAEAMK
jgi:hypothetical protein